MNEYISNIYQYAKRLFLKDQALFPKELALVFPDCPFHYRC
jgi:hypothetical protein